MFTPHTKQLLQKKLPVLPLVVCERSLKHDLDELMAEVMPPVKLAVVDDFRTRQVAGDRVFRSLKGRYATTHITLEGYPVADKQAVAKLRTQTLSCDAIVAVGGGTISDLCKYVSHLDGKAYVMFPTAASMNGYLSANASISEDGYKNTLPAHMPRAVFCDISVIAAAPARLNKSGLGDSLARSTAQADWLLSHLLLDTPYDDVPFALVKKFEPDLLENARGVALGDQASLELLTKILLLSGLGMTVAGGSYPASQSEHMIAHAHEMLLQKTQVPAKTFHGEEIGITASAMAWMQENFLRVKPKLRPNDFRSDNMIDLFGSKVTERARKAFDAKHALIAHRIGDRLQGWETIAEKIQKVILPADKINAALKAAHAPVRPQDIGWSEKDFDVSVQHARYLRERFTFLDLSPG